MFFFVFVQAYWRVVCDRVFSSGIMTSSTSSSSSSTISSDTELSDSPVQSQQSKEGKREARNAEDNDGGITLLETLLNGSADVESSSVSRSDSETRSESDKDKLASEKLKAPDENHSKSKPSDVIADKPAAEAEKRRNKSEVETQTTASSAPPRQRDTLDGEQSKADRDAERQKVARPCTAKPGRSRNRRKREISSNLSTSSSECSGRFQQKNRVTGNAISSSSASTISSYQDDDSVVEDTTILIEEKAREILLHKYLELHLQKHLDNQSSYFQRGYSTGKPRKRYSNRISKSEWRSRRLAKQTCSKQPSKPYKFDLQPLGEAAVQRTIRQLVADLSKYGRYGKNAEMETRRDLDGKPPRPKSGSCSGKSRHRFASQQVVTSSSSRSQSDFSSDESSSKRSPVVVPIASERAEEEQHPSRKSILKSDEIRRGKVKNVRMATESDMEGRSRRMRKHEDKSADPHKSHPTHGDFSYSYLAALLGTLRRSSHRAENHGDYTLLLRPAPIRSRSSDHRSGTGPARDRASKNKSAIDATKRDRIVRKNDATSADKQPENKSYKLRKNKQSTSTTLNTSDKRKTPTAKTESEVKHEPRIRPGTEPIKCNWDPKKSGQSEYNKNWCSDHQLKNSQNPAVVEWLRRKNELSRQERVYKNRQNRRKRDKLMEEFNERENQRENALVEYERWKKRKNREILLRRRREASEANAAHCDNKISTERPKSAWQPPTSQQDATKDATATSFSDLRSSSFLPEFPSSPPDPSLTKPPARRRPKSAPTKVTFDTPVATMAMTSRTDTSEGNFIPVRIDFESGDVTVLTPREEGGSGRNGEKGYEEKKTTGSGEFLRDFLKDENQKSMFDVSPPGNFRKKTDVAEDKKNLPGDLQPREHYEKWMRSNGTSSPYQIKYNRKKKKKKGGKQLTPSPPHDPLTNELISNLAKRRIRKILDQKKRVDSGLGQKTNQKQIEEKETEKVSSDAPRRWRLRQDYNQPPMESSKSRKKITMSSDRDKRPVFSYRRKTNSKSVFHERNPVINQAMNA
ncbi:uncharacterized protein LOC143471049 [Clavelina lepadiformis]|uniref:uncharacterized protein LOC143471049 n=1 Tax=Clavelina lepadiformis TaxID=159417 RepID=UPI0040425BE3